MWVSRVNAVAKEAIGFDTELKEKFHWHALILITLVIFVQVKLFCLLSGLWSSYLEPQKLEPASLDDASTKQRRDSPQSNFCSNKVIK